MKKPPLYLEFIIRSGHQSDTYKHEDRDEELFVYIPLSNTWQEGPDDLHVHFFTKKDPHTVPYHPEYDEKTGDYIIPDPRKKEGFLRCWHMGVCAKPQYEPSFVGGDKYVKRVMDHWCSPCIDRMGSSSEILAYQKYKPKKKK
jgi:hypothetical protein